MTISKNVVEKNFEYIRDSVRQEYQEFFIALFLYDVAEIKKEEITDEIIASVNNILDKTDYYYDEQLRVKISNIKTKILNEKFNDLINNYIDNCTDQEWEYLERKYNISDEENYMGEVRDNMEEALMADFEDADEEGKEELLTYFNKYKDLEKVREEEIEK